MPILSCIGLVIMIIMIHPDPVISGQIFLFAGASLALCAVWSVCWVKFVMKKPLFETVPLEQLRAKLEVMENEEAFDEEEESVTIV